MVLCGLPGTGKSYCAAWLAQRAPLYIVESDHLRRLLFHEPTHSPEESARLFRACHALVETLLQDGTAVLFDATNLLEVHRAYLYQIAERVGVGLVLLFLTAPPEVVFRRLQVRSSGPGQNSSADWEVYQRMRSSVEPVRRRHFSINTGDEAALQVGMTQVLEEIRRHLEGRT